MTPPAGVLPNFHHPANLDVYVILTITLCIAFATLAVLLRMYTKVFILRVLAWEDCECSSSIFREIPVYLRIPLRCHFFSMGKDPSENKRVLS